MSLKATQKYRKTPKGLLTNLYSKMKERIMGISVGMNIGARNK